MAELLQTERTYVKDLETCLKVSGMSAFYCYFCNDVFAVI